MDSPISYNYIHIGKEIWYKNRLDSPTEMPYLLSTVKSKNDSNKKCFLINGDSTQYANTLPYFNDTNINIDDLSILEDINEMDILNNLLNRFSSKVYFTDMGNILLFLNPYTNKEQIYNEEILNIYSKKNLENKNTVYMPHLYKNIFHIIENIKGGKNNKQTILIQGEVGTGKSEIIKQSIKYILSYFQNDKGNHKSIKSASSNYINIAFENNTIHDNYYDNDNYDYNLFNSDDTSTSNEGGFYSLFNYKTHQNTNNENISKKIIASIIVFEAFGNAKTFNNDNSTRLLNYLKMKFNQNFTKITGAEIYAFLLDKNRVSNLEPNKGNNFNIFYYLIKCGSNDLLRKLFLFSDNILNYNYLKSNNHSIDNTSYTKVKFRKLKEAFIILGFNNGEMFTIFKIISSIILLGNLQIKIDDDLKLLINDNDTFFHICNLLNIDSNEFISALINQEASVGKNNLYLNKDNNILYYKNSNNYNYYNGNDEIEKMKNNFANELYNQLFLWIVNKINNNINNNNPFDNEGEKTITFFDFCGYENNYSYKYNNIIYLNSLEQLFINYMNELIFYFYLKDHYLNRLPFFQKEGFTNITEKIQNEYDNKKDILNSINYLLNEIKIMQNDKNIKIFISDLEKDVQVDEHSKKKFKKVKYNKMMKNTTNSSYFLVHHTSEDVFYNLIGFLYKNTNNFIPWSLLDCLLKSKNSIIRNIYKNNRINTIGVNINITDKKSNENYYNYNYENIINNGFVTLGEEFKCFIKEIKKEIKQSKRNYIICLKSNQNIKPLLFTPNFIFNQLKNFKILHSIKQLDNNFYPIIINFNDFFKNYKITQNRKVVFEFEDAFKDSLESSSIKMSDIYRKECINIINDLINYISKNNKEKVSIYDDSILIGKNKILMKEKIYNLLEKERKRRIEYKTKAINNIKIGINYLLYRHYCKDYKDKKILEKISKIHCLMKTFSDKNRLQRYNEFMYFLQNSLRIICAKKKFEELKNKRDFLIIRLKIYLEKIKFKNILNESNVIKNKSTVRNMYAIHKYYFFNNFIDNKADASSNNTGNNYQISANNDNLNNNPDNLDNNSQDIDEDKINTSNTFYINNTNSRKGRASKISRKTKDLNSIFTDNNDNNIEDDNNLINEDIKEEDNHTNSNINTSINKDINEENKKKEEEKNQKEDDINNNNNDNKKNLFDYNHITIQKEKRLTIINPNNLETFLKGIDKNLLNKKNNLNNNKVDKMSKKDINDNKNKGKKENKRLSINQIKCKSYIKVFQEHLLFNKISKNKKYIKKIYTFYSCQILSKHYSTMIKNVIIIQKFIKDYLEKQTILNNAFYHYMNNNNSNGTNEIYKKINKILFPYRKINININKEKNIINNKEDNKNDSIDINIGSKNKNTLSTNERYKRYKKLKQLYDNSNRSNKDNKISLNNRIDNNKSISIKVNHNVSNNKNLHQLKEEEKDNYSSSNSEEKSNNDNHINKLIKDIPNLSIKNKDNSYQDYLYSSSYNNQTNYSDKYYDNKLYILSKIIDIDILTEISIDEEFNEILWVQEYKKIYEYNLNNKTPIQQIYLSDTHTLLINNIGNIFLFGFNEKGQCGILDNDIDLENKNYNFNYFSSDLSLSLYKYYNNAYGSIREAILGEGYTLILNNTGKTYSFGDYLNLNNVNNSFMNNSNNTVMNNNKSMKNIQSIQGKGNLNIYLSKTNKLFLSFTSNKDFISKNNINNNSSQNIPIQMFLTDKINISSISCGYNFYILLSAEGKLYSGGSNDYGELCSIDNNNHPRITPEEITEISKLNEKVIQVSCGFKHVIILTSLNNVYGWGNNSFGQLFSNNIIKKAGVVKLDYNNDEAKIIQVSAGFRSSFIMNENNEIYYFGVLNRNKKNITGEPKQIFIEEKNNEYGNKSQFVPVKINSRWNRQFSLFYITFADIRNFSYKIEYSNNKNENENIKDILTLLSSKWLNDSIKVPYIQEISKYFNKNYMEKPDKIKKINYY